MIKIIKDGKVNRVYAGNKYIGPYVYNKDWRRRGDDGPYDVIGLMSFKKQKQAVAYLVKHYRNTGVPVMGVSGLTRFGQAGYPG